MISSFVPGSEVSPVVHHYYVYLFIDKWSIPPLKKFPPSCSTNLLLCLTTDRVKEIYYWSFKSPHLLVIHLLVIQSLTLLFSLHVLRVMAPRSLVKTIYVSPLTFSFPPLPSTTKGHVDSRAKKILGTQNCIRKRSRVNS